MSAFRRYLIAWKRKKELFLILLKGLSFVTFLIWGENLLLFPEAHKKSTKVHLNFMQSGLPLKTLHIPSNAAMEVLLSCQKHTFYLC